jgi:transposase
MDGSPSIAEAARPQQGREQKMTVKYLGIDLAKNVFQLHGEDATGEVIYRKRLGRTRLLDEVGKLAPCCIGIEACTGAFYWQREFEALGHTVRIIAPQYVKPFAQHQKNDQNDAAAICTAMQQSNMRFVPPKTLRQQDIQALHRGRQRLVNHRTALVSQMRGLLLDRGLAFGLSITRARREIPHLLSTQRDRLGDLFASLLEQLFEMLCQLDARVKWFDREIERIFRADEACQRIAQIRGVGPKTATAIVAAVGDGAEFKNGRHLAAWLGLVPRQHSSGNKQRLFGISKRGDRHLRTLLVHGARAVLRTAPTRSDTVSQWAVDLQKRRGAAKAIVAIANKNARIIFAMLRKGSEFSPA